MRALGALFCACSAASPDAGMAVASTDAGPVDAGDWSSSSARCGGCHVREHSQWRASAHRTSFGGARFEAELRGENAFCGGCHAPLGRPEEGVGCAACHLRDGVVIASSVSGRAPHPSRIDPDAAGVGACARCHDFAFPDDPTLAMQATVHEWEESGSERACASCHLPSTDGRTDHTLYGPSGEMLESSVRVVVRAVRTDRGVRVRARLSAGDVGHSVPSGDVFRALELRVSSGDHTSRVRLDRGIRVVHGQGLREVAADRRVPPRGARTVELLLQDGGDRVRWSLDWLALPMHHRPELVDRRPIASGTVRVTGP
jgi:hypothetical protein